MFTKPEQKKTKRLGANGGNRIEGIRRENNVNWMNILRIAFKYSPKDTSKVFKRIFEDDKIINSLSKKLF